MEASLENILKGPQGLFDHIERTEVISELEIGAVLASDYTGLANPFQYFRVLFKIWQQSPSSPSLQSYTTKKQAQIFSSFIKQSKQSILISQLAELLTSLEHITTGFRKYSLQDRLTVENLVLETYKGLKFAFRETPNILKIIKFGKTHSDIFIEVNDEVVNIEELDKLLSIFESDDFVQGSLQLNTLCQKVLPKRVPFLYDFITTALVYLIEKKAKSEHFEQISQFFMINAKSFNKKKKKKIAEVYMKFTEKIGVGKGDEWEELINSVLLNLGVKILLVGKNEELRNNEKKICEGEKEDKGKRVEDKGVVNKFDNKKRGKANNNFVPEEEVKKSKDFKAGGKKGARGKKCEEEVKVKGSQKLEKNESSDKHLGKADMSNPEKSNNEVLENESQISELISEAKYLFDNKQRIEIPEFYERFMQINYSKPSSLFHKIDELISKGRPSEENAKFWSIILKILDKLPDLNHYEMLALRDKHKKLKGKIRDNKEKVSRKKEKKQEYKENLKKENKFIEGFKNGDREQKRGQKSQIDNLISNNYQEFKEYFLKLTEELNKFIEDQSMNQETLSRIDKAIKSIRAQLKSVSPSVSVKIVGSAGIGTYLKGREIDLLISDEKSSVAEYLPRVFEDLKPINESILQYSEKDFGFVFNFYLKNELQCETTALIKKYCMIDNRVTKLIILFKLWLRSEDIKWISGFQACLMVLGFLQNANPAVIVSLQKPEHGPKVAFNDVDVWFDAEYSVPSSNLWIFGELVYHFFNYFPGKLKGIFNTKFGSYLESQDFQVLHPFTQENVVATWSESEINLLGALFTKALGKLNSFESLSEIIF